MGRFRWNNAEGWTAFSVAAFCGHADVVGVLRNHGANPLLGTSFFKDSFAIADKGYELQAKSLEAGEMLAIKGDMKAAMHEFVVEGSNGPRQYLTDRRPVAICGGSGMTRLAVKAAAVGDAA